MKITRMTALLVCGLACSGMTACDKGGKEDGYGKGGDEMAGPLVTCGQRPVTGRSAQKTYANAQACVNDRATLQTAARADGIKQCKDFCKGLGATCTPQPKPNPQRTTHPCNVTNAGGQIIATGATQSFDCICKRP